MVVVVVVVVLPPSSAVNAVNAVHECLLPNATCASPCALCAVMKCTHTGAHKHAGL